MKTPYRSLCPPLRTEEYAALEKSIQSEGCRESLILWQDNLLDGHNRLSVCQMHELPYETREIDLPDEDAAKEWIYNNQIGRRNLTDTAFGNILGELYNHMRTKQGGDRKSNGQNVRSVNIAKVLGEKYRVNEKTVRRAGKMADEINELPPNLKDAVLNESTTLAKIQRDRRKQEQQSRPKPVLSPADFRILHCAIADLEAENLDCIITDPPYPREFLHVYDDLAVFAERSLRPGGSLLAMVGQSYLPEIIDKLANTLNYHWTVAYLMPGGKSVQLWKRKVNNFWKPVLWFVKGQYQGDWIGDVCRSDVNDREKEHHDWGQSESGMADIVERFTIPGDRVCDPFMGGGTTAAVCARLHRKFIGCDVDENCVRESRQRIHGEFTLGGS